jgi:hypothetical protein
MLKSARAMHFCDGKCKKRCDYCVGVSCAIVNVDLTGSLVHAVERRQDLALTFGLVCGCDPTRYIAVVALMAIQQAVQIQGQRRYAVYVDILRLEYVHATGPGVWPALAEH